MNKFSTLSCSFFRKTYSGAFPFIMRFSICRESMSDTCLRWTIRSSSQQKNPLKVEGKSGRGDTQGKDLRDGFAEWCKTTPITSRRYWIATPSRGTWWCSGNNYVGANHTTYTCVGSVRGKRVFKQENMNKIIEKNK